MVKKLAGYFTGLVALYIITANASNFGKVITSGAAGGSQMTKTLQGR